VHRAPAILFGVWALAVLAGSPAGVGMSGLQSFGMLDNLRAWLSDAAGPASPNAGAARLALWMFLSGGIIDRYARDRATRAMGFFGAAGVYFFRFLRLAVILAVAY